MNFKSALNRMIWRFQEFDRIMVNANDIKAVNKIVAHVNQNQSQSFKNNIHFAKLYTHTLAKFLEKYDTTIDDPLVHRELHHLLSRPLENIVYDLTCQMNLHSQYKLLKASGYKNTAHPKLLTQFEKDTIISNLERLLANPTNRQIFFKDAWTIEEVEEGLYNQINNFLNGI